MRILIVDDHFLLREGLVSLFNSDPQIEVVGEASSVQEAVSLTQELDPDVVLMDFGLPDGNGLDATKAILGVRPKVKIVFLTVHEDDDYLFEALRAGAKGYLLKNIRPQELVSYVKNVHEGGAALTPSMTSKVLDEFARSAPDSSADPAAVGPEILSAREWQVVELIAKGMNNQQIAHELIIAENTVKSHVHNILTKLGLQNRRQVAAFYRRWISKG